MENNHLVLKELNMEDLNTTNGLVKYYDGDVAIVDDIHDLKDVAPLYAKMNFIIICTNGRIQFEINDTQLHLRKEEILLSAPYVVLDNYMFSPDFECKILCLSDDIIHAMLGDLVNKWNIHIYSRHTNVISLPKEDCEQFNYYYGLIRFKMQHQERPNNSLTMQAVIQAMLFDVIGLLSKEPEAESEENGKDAHGRMLFEHFLQLITSNEIKRRPVDYYSEQLHVTSKYLTTLCTKYSGKSASAWIHQYTKEDIRHYLLHTSLSIKEIAYKMGFPSLSFFGSYVRHYFGMSPSKLRAK
ncbi:MAG: helix-turn-helix domain-containing protein [Prevotellaceae bacterium]|nr:helix-turn-helix domain-containing protein [Prevotellaceae bacterium]